MDNFEIQEELGRGTFGVVRKCLDKRTQKIVAVKGINMELNGQSRDTVANEIKVSCIDFDNANYLQLSHCMDLVVKCKESWSGLFD